MLGHRLLLTALIGLSWCFDRPSIEAQEPSPPARRFFEVDGPILEAGKFNAYFKLQTDGPNLETKIETSYREANTSLVDVRRAFGGSGGSSSSTGQWSINFRGQEAIGEVSFGTGPMGRITGRIDRDSSPKLRVKFLESTGARRGLWIIADEGGAFQVTVRSQDPPALFRFKQDENKRIVCQDLAAGSVFAAEAESFDQFCSQHHEFVDQRLFPILKFLGTGVPVTRFSPNVQELVLRHLVPPDPEMVKRFKLAVDGLDVGSFDDRQAATQEIQDDFESWRDLIQLAIHDPQYPVEVRSRLNKIYQEQVSRRDRERVKMAQDSTLQENPEYLVWLWEQLDSKNVPDSKAKQQLVSGQLAKLTNQNFGDDLVAWQNWLAHSANPASNDQVHPPTAESSLEECFLNEMGPIDSVDEYIGQLLRFELNGKDLILDRDHWGKEFGGKSISETNEDVLKLLKERNLPSDWYKPGGNYSPDATGYPQVIFENLVSHLEVPESSASRRRVYYYGALNKNSSRNRQSVSPSAEAGVEFHDPSPQDLQQMRFGGLMPARGNKPPGEDYFLFYFRETTKPYRSLEIRESKQGAITIELLSESTDSILRLVQAAADDKQDADDRIQIFDIRGGRMAVMKGQSFQSLWKGNRNYISNQWIPVFEQLGVEFSVDNQSRSE